MAASPSVLGEVLEIFERNFRERREIGASVSVWWNGTELLSEGHGWCEKERRRPWTTETLAPVYSATKVPSAATLLMALEEKGLGPGTPVREVWPAFPVEEATFSDLLSHQCGLAALDQKAEMFDHASVVRAIEAQTPAWRPGQGHGYHPRTFGALVEEPVRRLTGNSLGHAWREKLADPLELDFWIGLPESEWPRVARLYPGKPEQIGEGEAEFYRQMAAEGTYTRRAFSSPGGLRSIQEMNDPRAWSAGLPALGGVGTARALAKFYQAAIGAIGSPLTPSVRHALATPVSCAADRVLLRPTVFTCGAQMDPEESGRKTREVYGTSSVAFGHPGAGGSHAFGDPASGLSFAYTMNQMNLSVMPGAKCLEMAAALFSET